MITEDSITIGSDESLKGDTFGGLTVAAVLTNNEQRQQLEAIGITDSKKIPDNKIEILAKRIKEICPLHKVYNIYPEQYNEYSMTGLLNKYHQEAYQNIMEQYTKQATDQQPVHIVDKYPGCNVGDIAETKAESKYVSVAAASVLAREAALQQMDELSAQLGWQIPKGSTHVDLALRKFFALNLDPKKYMKTNFKNVRKHIEGNHK